MTAPTVASPGTTSDLRRLPVDPDDGFPQSFLLAVGERTYQIELHVNVAEHLLDRRAGPRTVLDLVGSVTTAAQGILVASVRRRTADGSLVTLLHRRLVPGLLYTAGELSLVLDELSIAAGNLNGAGSFGSVLRARAGLR